MEKNAQFIWTNWLVLTQKQRNKMISVLKECEVRGTDATGIAYNCDGLWFTSDLFLLIRCGSDSKASVIMGHTRMTTQGSENNFPITTISKEMWGVDFVSAIFCIMPQRSTHKHRSEKHNLPQTNIETDSYSGAADWKEPSTSKALKTWLKRFEVPLFLLWQRKQFQKAKAL